MPPVLPFRYGGDRRGVDGAFMPADGVLQIDLAYGRGKILPIPLLVSVCDVAELPAGSHAYVCVLPEGPRTSPLVAAQGPMPAGGVQ
jgi:hypothetical protein